MSAPTFSYVQPVSGTGFDRACCLTSFASGVSGVNGLGLLGNGEYETGNIYSFDGVNVTLDYSIGNQGSPTSTTISLLFGSWVNSALNGQLPTAQATGGLVLQGGGYGGAFWSNVAYTGTYSLAVQASWGGVMGWDTALPATGYAINGTEVFTLQYQALDTVPDQVELQIYDSTNQTWHNVYVGSQDFFGFGGLSKGAVPATIGSWNSISFSWSDIGLSIGDIITGLAWGVWKQIGTSTVTFSDFTVTYQSSAVPIAGYIDCTTDGASGFYLLGKTGPLVHVPLVGQTPVITTLNLSPSFAYTGITYNPVDGKPYFIGYDGTIYNYNGTIPVLVTGPPGGVQAPARWLKTDGNNNLYTMFSNSNDIAYYNIGSSTWIVSGSPFNATLDTIHYSNSLSALVAGGSNYIDITNTATIIDLAYALGPNQLLVADNTPRIRYYNFFDGGWNLVGPASGYTGTPTYIAAEPDGLQVLVTDNTNNLVEVLTASAGAWSQTSTVAITAPTSLAIMSSGLTQALVCQPTQNQVTVLNKTGLNWVPIQNLSINDPTYVDIQNYNGSYSAVISTSSGVTFANFNGINWSLGQSINVSPPPTVVAADHVSIYNPLYYGAVSNGGNTIVYIFNNTSLLGSYTITGDVLGGLLVLNYQIYTPTYSGKLYGGFYIGGTINHKLSSTTVPASGSRLIYVPTVTDFLPQVLISGPNDIWLFYDDFREDLTRITDSEVAILNGITWSPIFDTHDMNKISSIVTDIHGNTFAINVGNEIYKWTSGGSLVSGYPALIVPPTGQLGGVPLGFSKLVTFRNEIYASSSMAGGILVVTE